MVGLLHPLAVKMLPSHLKGPLMPSSKNEHHPVHPRPQLRIPFANKKLAFHRHLHRLSCHMIPNGPSNSKKQRVVDQPRERRIGIYLVRDDGASQRLGKHQRIGQVKHQ